MSKTAKTAAWVIILIIAAVFVWLYLGRQSASTVISPVANPSQTSAADNNLSGQSGTTTQAVATSSEQTDESNSQTGAPAVPTSELDSDATLSALATTAGPVSPAFDPSVTSYSLELPAGTTNIPAVSAMVNDTGKATYVVTQAQSLPGSAFVSVAAQDGVTTQTYTVNFTVAVSGQ